MYQIMLVEDEILVRESMVQNTNWRALGFDAPIACSDGREAMQVLETVRPDVVITDICMPFQLLMIYPFDVSTAFLFVSLSVTFIILSKTSPQALFPVLWIALYISLLASSALSPKCDVAVMIYLCI